jgi:hypothetical protein
MRLRHGNEPRAKASRHAAKNPLSVFRTEMTVDKVLGPQDIGVVDLHDCFIAEGDNTHGGRIIKLKVCGMCSSIISGWAALAW